jgi:spermidine synthase
MTTGISTVQPGAIPAAGHSPAKRLPTWVPVTFFASGFAALVYQVVWQRALYAIFGINIESVTVIVTAFLMGLGFGSLVGGRLSLGGDRAVLLRRFGAIELGIGAFGAASLWVYRWVGDATLAFGSFARGVMVLLVVLIPTTLMGATLPLLVTYAVRRSGNVGRSVGLLYFVNTAGSALAALMAVVTLMPRLGQSGTVALAAAINGAVAGTALFNSRGGSDAP